MPLGLPTISKFILKKSKNLAFRIDLPAKRLADYHRDARTRTDVDVRLYNRGCHNEGLVGACRVRTWPPFHAHQTVILSKAKDLVFKIDLPLKRTSFYHRNARIRADVEVSPYNSAYHTEKLVAVCYRRIHSCSIFPNQYTYQYPEGLVAVCYRKSDSIER